MGDFAFVHHVQEICKQNPIPWQDASQTRRKESKQTGPFSWMFDECFQDIDACVFVLASVERNGRQTHLPD